MAGERGEGEHLIDASRPENPRHLRSSLREREKVKHGHWSGKAPVFTDLSANRNDMVNSSRKAAMNLGVFDHGLLRLHGAASNATRINEWRVILHFVRERDEEFQSRRTASASSTRTTISPFLAASDLALSNSVKYPTFQ